MREQTDNKGAWNTERKKTNRTALLAVALAAVMILTFFAGYFVRGTVEPAESQEMTALMKIIKERWMSDKDTDELAADFINLVIKPYDQYAKYYTPQEYKILVEEDKGRYSGVGIGIRENNDGNVQVAKVYLNSPAYKNGIETGDVLVAGIKKGETDYIDFKNAVSEYNQDKEEKERITVLSMINDFFSSYDVGDEIKLKFQRGSAEPEEKTLKKENYTVSYVEYRDNETYYYFSTEDDGFNGREPKDAADKVAGSIPTLDDDTAYIKFYEFEGGAAEQFEQALDFMHTQGRTKLILDLRDNGGGLLDILLEITSYLVNNKGAENIRVLNIKEKNAENHYSTVNRFENWFTDISVIANAGTASAAECLIGALLDYGNREQYQGLQFGYDRLVLTPKKDENGNDVYRTYGKGIMQTTYSLPSGGALKLTTAKIFWPLSYRCVQDNGVTSDIHETDEQAIMRANAVLH